MLNKGSIWQNILAAVALSLFIVFLFLQGLDLLTRHNDHCKVPDIKGKSLMDARLALEKTGLEVVIQDSVYYDSIKPGIVLKQFPEPDATVKVGRSVYLTVNRYNPPFVEIPNLLGLTFRNAELELRSNGFKLGDTTYVPDIARNAVKEMLVGGRSLKPGTPVPMGSRVSLVLGAGIGSEESPVPDLFGLTYAEAYILLQSSGINMGVVLADPGLKDTAAGYVYWQNPERLAADGRINRIRSGQMMDLKLSVEKREREPEFLQDTTSGDGDDGFR